MILAHLVPILLSSQCVQFDMHIAAHIQIEIKNDKCTSFVAVGPDIKFVQDPNKPAEPTSYTWVVVNSGKLLINWNVSEKPAWLDIEPQQGVLQPRSFSLLTITTNQTSRKLRPGNYSGLIRFQHYGEQNNGIPNNG